MFGPDEKQPVEKKDGQQTVNEEMTTDTQLDSEFEREAAIQDETTASIPKELQKKFAKLTADKFDTGI